MSRSLNLYLNDILKSIGKIQKFTAQTTQADLVQDERTFDAVVYNLQIIGEATRNIPEDIRNQQPQIEWKNIIGIRNIITHTYFSVDDEIVWNIIQTKLEPLKTAIELIQQNQRPSPWRPLQKLKFTFWS